MAVYIRRFAIASVGPATPDQTFEQPGLASLSPRRIGFSGVQTVAARSCYEVFGLQPI